ncbi:MAG: DNA-processing protein DprA [Tannerella sp.]|jgi:DNA processing protein|nr:DNA-processing protein DprA [Tannerella sp.]
MANDGRIYLIGLTQLKGIGSILARQLLIYFDGKAEKAFSENRHTLEKIPGIGSLTAGAIVQSRTEALRIAEKELEFIEKNKIRLVAIGDSDYPYRLFECQDAPLVFYARGDADLNARRILSIVGTRKATDYGVKQTERLVKGLSEISRDILVISGLAYGIDICAHRSALKFGLPTVGVLAHGMDRIYPQVHRRTAIEMLEQSGGLLTDFVSGTSPERENFLQRNRLIAGLSDATVVIESAQRGGALTTADIAFSYGRSVYAFPGRVDDRYSEGCNLLIRTNKAELISSAQELAATLGWDVEDGKAQPKQSRLAFAKERPESPVLDAFAHGEQIQIDELSLQLDIPVHKLAPELLELEMAGYLRALPGGVYKADF